VDPIGDLFKSPSISPAEISTKTTVASLPNKGPTKKSTPIATASAKKRSSGNVGVDHTNHEDAPVAPADAPVDPADAPTTVSNFPPELIAAIANSCAKKVLDELEKEDFVSKVAEETVDVFHKENEIVRLQNTIDNVKKWGKSWFTEQRKTDQQILKAKGTQLNNYVDSFFKDMNHPFCLSYSNTHPD